MRSAYASDTDPAEVRHDFALGLKSGVAQGRKPGGRSPYSDIRAMTAQYAPVAPFAPLPVYHEPLAHGDVPYPPKYDLPLPAPACPGTPRCLTSFPKDWLWNQSPAGRAQSMTREGSWPGEKSVFGGNDKWYFYRRGIAAARGTNPYLRGSWQHESWQDGWYSLRPKFGA